MFKSEINTENPGATESTALPALLPGLFPSFGPTWSQALPPPPPPPPGTIIVDGTTTGGPTFDRPEGAGPGQLGAQVAYDAFEFASLGRGFYDIRSEQDYDGYVHLYTAPFDPNQPLVNLLAGNDDLETNRASGFRILLEPNTDYVLVTSAFAAGDEGNFTTTIIPPQLPAAGEAPILEQITETVRVAEPGESIGYSFFFASTDAITCSVDYGDGTVEAVSCDANNFASASHSFAAPGFYTVVVTATNAGGSAEGKAFPTIAVNDPNAFDIVVVFGNDQLSPAQRAAFQIAANRWAEVIGGDLGDVSSGSNALPDNYSCRGEPAFNGTVDDVVISAVGEPIDGPGAILGSAGPCRLRDGGTNGTLAPLPVYGAMRFDVADLAGLEADGTLEAVILHEMGHVLGIGTLWNANGYLSGTVGQGADPNDPNYDPRYNGPVGVAQFNVLLSDAGQPSDASVPAANTGGAGTREGHWREATFFNELMTGFLGAAPNPLSIQTIGGLEDLGYQVDFASADSYGLPNPFAILFRQPARGYDTVWTIDDVK